MEIKTDALIEEGSYLNQVLSPNQMGNLVAVLHCSHLKDCNHVFMNDTGIFFLSAFSKVTSGTGTLYLKETSSKLIDI